MAESLSTRAERLAFNLFPCWRGTGARVTYIASDHREMRVKLSLSWRTRNYVGTIFGGSLYAATDPPLMIMLMKNLGEEYVVWDKAANIRFLKPGRSTLYARFVITEEDLESIRKEAAEKKSLDRIFRIELADKDGVVHAEVDKTIYIRRKSR